MMPFDKKVVFVGYGAVAQCTLPILFKHLHIRPHNITVIDFEDRTQLLQPYTAQGVKFVRDRVGEGNLAALLGEHLQAGDVLIDLAWNIDCCVLLQWCREHGV